MINVCFDECVFGAMKFGLKEKSTYSYYGLCYGQIALETFDEIRIKRINKLYSLCSQRERNRMIKKEKQRFDDILNVAKREKTLRIWYANNASDKCGLYHLIDALQEVDCKIFAVQMPSDIGYRDSDWEKSWGEAEPEHFYTCLPLARELKSDERDAMSRKWQQLVIENSLLRIIEDGEVKSVPVDSLDNIILSNAPDDLDFKAGNMVGCTLGCSAHYFSVAFVEWRVEEMIKNGILSVIEKDEDPERWNMMVLRKNVM